MKAEGGNDFHFFETSLDAKAQERRQIILDMRSALAQGQFQLKYQPVIDLRTGAIAGCEALLRWNHPTLDAPPEKFAPYAEETGLICEIGAWAIEQACRDATRWPNHASVAVNLSPAQFKRDGLPEPRLSSKSCLKKKFATPKAGCFANP